MSMAIPRVKMRLYSAAHDKIDIVAYDEARDAPIAVLAVKRTKRLIRFYARWVGTNQVAKGECRNRDTEALECLEDHFRQFWRQNPEYANSDQEAWEALENLLAQWEDIVEAERLRAIERSVTQGIEPVIEAEVEGRVIRVLASDGVELPAHGGFADLGPCLVVTESTFAYTTVSTPEAGEIETITMVSVAAVYRRTDSGLELVERKVFFPYMADPSRNRLEACGRLIRIKVPTKASLTYKTYPDVSVFNDFLEGRPPSKSWAEVGREILGKLRESIVHEDERHYYIEASYAVATYIYDLFTAVPYLWFYGPPGSGKTRANITVTYMSRHGVFIANPSDASLYRLADAAGPTMGIDESALTPGQKLILASSYKKGAAIPRAEPTRKGIELRLFDAVAPRIFSFIDPPEEDYQRQRTILINMVKSRPKRSEDPQPEEYQGIRDALYHLRLVGLPEALKAKSEAERILDQHDVWGREKEIWWPILTAAILIGAKEPVLDYILEDVKRRRESEEMYAAEKAVLAAIEAVFEATPEPLDGGEKIARFRASDLQRHIIRRVLEEEDCIDVVGEDQREREVVKPECRKREEQLKKQWSTQRIGRVLERLGFTKYKKAVGKGAKKRPEYFLPWSEFLRKARIYGYGVAGPEEPEEPSGNTREEITGPSSTGEPESPDSSHEGQGSEESEKSEKFSGDIQVEKQSSQGRVEGHDSIAEKRFPESGYTPENSSDSSDFSDHHAAPVLTGMVGSEMSAGQESTLPTHSSDPSPLEILKKLVERHGDSWCLSLEELERETDGRAREIIRILEERGDRYCYGV